MPDSEPKHLTAKSTFQTAYGTCRLYDLTADDRTAAIYMESMDRVLVGATDPVAVSQVPIASRDAYVRSLLTEVPDEQLRRGWIVVE